MRRTEVLQEIRRMRFEEAYGSWTEGRLSQEEAAQLLGVCERTFRRYIDRYEEEGLDGLIDKRLSQVSHRRAPVDEVMRMVDRYRSRHDGWSVKHYYAWYRRGGGGRSYNWVRKSLQAAGAVTKAAGRGQHRKRRERAPVPGVLLHQDGSTHAWVPGQTWDLIVTMDDATSRHYSMFFCDQEGTRSSFQGVREVVEAEGLFCSLYTDRGSHYWHTPTAGGKVDKGNSTQFRRALQQLGVEMIAAYSPQARGRSERAFSTHQNRLVKELAAAGITDMAAANEYLQQVYLPAFNEEFEQPPREVGSAFVPVPEGAQLDNIFCEHYERRVRKDNCIEFEGLTLQIPADRHRYHYIKAKVKVLRHTDGALSLWHGPRKLACYDAAGQLIQTDLPVAA